MYNVCSYLHKMALFCNVIKNNIQFNLKTKVPLMAHRDKAASAIISATALVPSGWLLFKGEAAGAATG